MKKLDLHIHTVPTIWEATFTFDLDILKKYVADASLDAIAITNHNKFNHDQYILIKEALDIVVFPGIEISLDSGHVLVISEMENLVEFNSLAEQVSNTIIGHEDRISTDKFFNIFREPDNYLVIPHYFKKPAIQGDALVELSRHTSCGEVDSAKKFIRVHKDDTKLTPLLFSDARMCAELKTLPTRQTFVDCGELTLKTIKSCLRDRGKVALSENDGNRLFQIFDDGQKLSTGLNVLLGERSSGKTFTLKKINNTHDNVKYIEQFSLVQQDEAACEREFSNNLDKTRSQFVDSYLSEFKSVLDDIMTVDLRADERRVEDYLSTLIESAEEADKRDSFSNTALFDESDFSISDDKVLIDLIGSTRQLIENTEYRSIIDKHVDAASLKRLAIELIELHWEKAIKSKKKSYVNSLVRDIKKNLKRRTSAIQIEDVDLYQVVLNRRKVDKFVDIVKHLQSKAIISDEHIQGFRIVATKRPFEGAGEIKKVSGTVTVFQDAYKKYDQPYDYLQMLLTKDLTRSELYKLFVKISYDVLNRDGFVVSGGERSEFRLLQEINDAQNHDLLLIDEPESSFDNIFLKTDVNQIIKELSESMPVVVVTHNNTVGASIGPDYLLYASKTIENGDVAHRLFAGYPTDKALYSLDGAAVSNYKLTLNSLEAGFETYEDRKRRYEDIKD